MNNYKKIQNNNKEIQKNEYENMKQFKTIDKHINIK